jgi:hypothetical protein
MKTIAWMVGALALAAIGFYAGTTLPRERGPSRGPSAPPPVLVREVAVGGGLSAQDVRDVVREELAARPAVVPTPKAVVPTPEQVARSAEAHARARRVLDDAIAAGRWTDDDARTVGHLLGSLTPDDALDLYQTLFPALNDGTVRAEITGAPFAP